MSVFLHSPGCPCCPGCLIFRTSFSNPTEDIDNFFIDRGNDNEASINDGYLDVDGDDTIVLATTPHPQYPYPPRLRVSMMGAEGSVLRMFISWTLEGTEASSGYIAELTPGVACGDLRIYQVIDGVETVLKGPVGIPRFKVDQWHFVSFCYDPRTDALMVHVQTQELIYSTFRDEATVSLEGRYAGVGTGPDHVVSTTEGALFDDFIFEKLYYYGDGTEPGPCSTVLIEEIAAGVPDSATYPGVGEYFELDNRRHPDAGGVGIWGCTIKIWNADHTNSYSFSFYEGDTEWEINDLFVEAIEYFGWNSNIAWLNLEMTDYGIRVEAGGSLTWGEKDITDPWIEYEMTDYSPYLDIIKLRDGGSEGGNEVQRIEVTGTNTYYSLTFGTDTTSLLSSSATAGEVQAALEALGSIGSGNVIVTSYYTGIYYVQFVGSLAKTDVDLLEANYDECYESSGYYYYYDEGLTECGSCERDGCESIDARFDSVDYLCEWFTDDGTNPDWEIDETSNVLRSLSAHTLLNKLEKSTVDENVQELWVRFKAGAAGDIVEGIICASDASNYLACQVQVGTGGGETIGIVKLVNVSSGSETVISDVHKINKVEAGEWYNLYVIYDADGYLTGWLWEGNDTAPFENVFTAWCVVESDSGQSCSGNYSGVRASAADLEISRFKTYWCSELGIPGCGGWRNSGADQFGDNGSLIDTNWTLISGDTPTVTADPEDAGTLNRIEWAAGQSGIVLSHDPVQPSVEDEYALSALFNDDFMDNEIATSAGAVVGLIFGSDDTASNYYLAELSIYAGDEYDPVVGLHYSTLTLYRVNSGVKTQLDQVTNVWTDALVIANKSYAYLAVCWQNGQAIVLNGDSVDLTGARVVAWSGGLTAYGRYWGLSVESHASYACRATAPNFYLIEPEAGCPGCPIDCEVCDDNKMPTEMVATVAGVMTPETYGCSGGPASETRNGHWEDVNTDWYLYPHFNPDTGEKVDCMWVSAGKIVTLEWRIGTVWYTQRTCFWVVFRFQQRMGISGDGHTYANIYLMHGDLNHAAWCGTLETAEESKDRTFCDPMRSTTPLWNANTALRFDDPRGPVRLAGSSDTVDCYKYYDGTVFNYAYSYWPGYAWSDVTITTQVPGDG